MQCLTSVTEEPTYEQQELGVAMEILRFEDTESPAPKRKHRSKGLVALGLVAALMGIGTAFASSTITVNVDNKVNLGQGVVTVSGCDSNIGFKPVTKLSSNASAFQVTDFIIGYKYNETDDGLIDTTACNLKQMKISLYKDKSPSGVDLVPCQATYDRRITSPFDPTKFTLAGGDTLEGSVVGIGKDLGVDGVDPDLGPFTAFKCGTDGSFYFLVDKTNLGTVKTMRIHWNDQNGFIFNANSFDHVTIESVSDEPGLTGATV